MGLFDSVLSTLLGTSIKASTTQAVVSSSTEGDLCVAPLLGQMKTPYFVKFKKDGVEYEARVIGVVTETRKKGNGAYVPVSLQAEKFSGTGDIHLS